MSNFGDFLHFPATNDCTRKPSSATAGDSLRQAPVSSSDPRIPLQNLSAVRSRMDSLQQFLSVSVKTNTLIGKDQMAMVSAEIATAIHQIIVNGAALLASSQSPNISPQSDHIAPNPKPKPPEIEITSPNVLSESDLKFNISDAADTEIPNTNQICINKDKAIADLKLEADDEVMSNESEIIELDAVELLAEQIHFCDICGKGFKRDANLRMHMRAHGNQFKTPEALAKPERYADLNPRRTRFSCPFLGCNRNKLHKKFRPLKSVICVKNHFKRSHCPKMYSCNRCNKKTFSVVADLKSHLKHCGETKWKCSCGTMFSRKDKLFGHMALFEGHMPAVSEEDERAKGVAAVVVLEDEEEEDRFVKEGELGANFLDNGFFDGLLEGFDSIENYSGLAGDGMDWVS